MIALHRSNRKKRKTQDGRRLRRYERRWLVERFFAWIQWQRRLLIRWEYYAENFLGFVAMTVEAVPRVDEHGRPIDPVTRKLMHTTMQTLGRVAIIGGSTLVALINLYLFTGVERLPQAEIALIYRDVYLMALTIPAISVLGVVSASLLNPT
jgi:hypothetical protein